MLNYNELKPGKFIVLDGQPFVVLEYSFQRMQMRKPVVQTKIKNLISGKVMERSFQSSESVNEAEIETRPVKYLYTNRGEFWFCSENNPSDRFKLDKSLVENYDGLMKPKAIIDAVEFNKQIIGIKLPVKIDLKVVEAPPAIKGNTSQGGTKQIKLETGMTINAPLFINEGDTVRINTETKEYVERAEKK